MAEPYNPEARAPGYQFRPAWRLDDSEVERDAIHFWNRLGILPPGEAPQVRAKQLMAVAYKDGLVVGVQTARIAFVGRVRARLAMIRSAVDPAHRRFYVSRALSVYSREIVQRWSAAHPEAGVAGLGALIESAELSASFAQRPYWSESRFILAGYAEDGRQLRISWFEDFRLD